MKTIRGKITLFFAVYYLFIGVATVLYYVNILAIDKKLVIMGKFDDLGNDILELRRYEKNFIYYKDVSNQNQIATYLSKIDSAAMNLGDDIKRVLDEDRYQEFRDSLTQYESVLAKEMLLVKAGAKEIDVQTIRVKGKALVDFSQTLIQAKRQRIKKALRGMLSIPVALLAAFAAFFVMTFHLVVKGILNPLRIIQRATEDVVRGTFTPIPYPKEKEDEVSDLIAAFDKMVQELDSSQDQLLQSRKMAAIGTFTSGIAHELNNPLNNISLTAESLLLDHRHTPEAETNAMLKDILIQAERAGLVVRNLLEFSRKEHEALAELSINEVIDSTVSLLRNQIKISGIELKVDPAGALPPIRGKRRDLQQVFLNILLNAVQAMEGKPKGGSISIRSQPGPKGYVRTDISDTGTGIKPADMEHIFDPFYTTKPVGHGTGLGLSLVYGIIKAHGGHIEVKSEVDKGTTFLVYLPTATPEEKGEELGWKGDRKADQEAS
jgi:two-component system NtrC family sensor kinase